MVTLRENVNLWSEKPASPAPASARSSHQQKSLARELNRALALVKSLQFQV